MYQTIIKQVARAGFGGPLLICLLKFTLNKKSLVHSLQFGTKYHVYSDSLRAQITEHTEYNYVTVALYCVGEELEKMMRTNKQIDRKTENSITEATLIPVDRRGERTNMCLVSSKERSGFRY